MKYKLFIIFFLNINLIRHNFLTQFHVLSPTINPENIYNNSGNNYGKKNYNKHILKKKKIDIFY